MTAEPFKRVPQAEGFGLRRRRAIVRLKSARFDLLTRVLGLDTDEARAKALGMTARTLYRARRGYLGHDFIAQTLWYLGEQRDALAQLNLAPAFDELFEVVDAADTPDSELGEGESSGGA